MTNFLDCRLHALFIRVENRSRIDIEIIKIVNRMPIRRVERINLVDIIAPKTDANGIIRIRKENIYRITLYAKCSSPELYITSSIL